MPVEPSFGGFNIHAVLIVRFEGPGMMRGKNAAEISGDGNGIGKIIYPIGKIKYLEKRTVARKTPAEKDRERSSGINQKNHCYRTKMKTL
ncbi:hypothetical protein HF324_05925 [Chitinophaga oryzae]|uniref:Uncharacterized protein n=1 Tax=Chitinophaga oryzae TaxID=2725414 RepID=A0AAE6ZF57_9BACT|nr:hypothetical protein [Chitinophaga oryzae]QJB30925.1 hypothetical protein HF329_06260 [Chitinophaga oryzae]QJB37414.1 hypothetical protein HF324_05925 [Chitinophaga oryzae]